jgi:acetoin utilization deacetylase AcuC-like enzyme
MLKIAWSEYYAHKLPEGHRFPMEKYNLIPEQLLYEGSITNDNLFFPSQLPDSITQGCHTAEYISKLNNLTLSREEIRRMGFPLSEKLIEREKIIMHGTLIAAEYALKHGIAFNVAGGTHHAFSDKAEGFCLLNDIAIASRYLLNQNLRKRILIVDLDVHQGNGTAQIFKEEPNVFTFSMHGEKNFPLIKEKSTLDIELPDGIDDKSYLTILKNTLPKIIDDFMPDFIFYQSGVDVLATDKLGRLGLSINGCKERDKIVLATARKNKIPLTASMGGGYSEKVSHIVEAHANTYRLAQELFF